MTLVQTLGKPLKFVLEKPFSMSNIVIRVFAERIIEHPKEVATQSERFEERPCS